MGRVGSTSIYNALSELEDFQITHTHMLNEERLNGFVRNRESRGLQMPNHVADSRDVIENIIKKNTPVKVISLVRDPMARNVSAFFNNLDSFGFRSVESRENATAEALLKKFSVYDHKIPIRWFSLEFRDVFGFSVFGTPFNFETKSLTIFRKNVSLLVLRLEDKDDVKIAALEKFLGVEGLTIPNDNSGGKFGEAYEQFKHLFKPDEELVNSIYNTKLVHHFYKPEEVRKMKARWINQ